jgi:hypothetical protein
MKENEKTQEVSSYSDNINCAGIKNTTFVFQNVRNNFIHRPNRR